MPANRCILQPLVAILATTPVLAAGDVEWSLHIDRLLHPPSASLVAMLPAAPAGSTIAMHLLDHDGSTLATATPRFGSTRASTPATTVDLLLVLPQIRTLERAAWLQLSIDGLPHGSAWVIEPLLEPAPVRTRLSMRLDGRTPFTEIVGWGNTPLPGAGREARETIEALPPHESRRLGWRTYPEMDVHLDTEAGPIAIALRPDLAPRSAWRFRALAEGGFYDGSAFHRVVPADRAGHPFVIQAGCPLGDGSGGVGERLALEPSPLPHEFGVVSMAREDPPDSASSQFFIALSRAGTAHLDGQFASFGVCVLGAETIVRIAGVPLADPVRGRPANPPRILRATLVPAPPRIPGRGRPDAPVAPISIVPDAPAPAAERQPSR
jgi:cyclophilin family peptidyl-prolyl cis-trans isomerase